MATSGPPARSAMSPDRGAAPAPLQTPLQQTRALRLRLGSKTASAAEAAPRSACDLGSPDRRRSPTRGGGTPSRPSEAGAARGALPAEPTEPDAPPAQPQQEEKQQQQQPQHQPQQQPQQQQQEQQAPQFQHCQAAHSMSCDFPVLMPCPPATGAARGSTTRRRRLAVTQEAGGGGGRSAADADADASFSPEPAAQRWRAGVVQALSAAARERRWHLAGEPDGEDTPSARVVVAEVAEAPEARQVLRQALSAGARAKVPLVVALLAWPCSDGWDGRRDEILQAQREFLAAGADDVALVHDSQSAALSVSMGVVRSTAKAQEMQTMQMQIFDECEAELMAELKRIEAQSKERVDGLFWQCAHKLFSGLPQMSPDIGSSPKAGFEVAGRKLEGQIGQGAFGAVFAAKGSEGWEAVKVLDKSKIVCMGEVSCVNREIRTLRTLQHPGIVGFRGAFHGRRHLFICMDFVGKSLKKRIATDPAGRLSREQSRDFLAQLLDALAHTHDVGIAHRDIKPENLAVAGDGKTLKLLDFGSVAPLNEECFDMAGTMPFMSPEVLAAADTEPYVPAGCDIWASGVVMLEMLCGMGMMNRMLQWGNSIEPEPARCDELRAFFADPAPTQEALAAVLGRVDEPLLALVLGMFELDWKKRLSASEAGSCAYFSAARA